MGTTRTLNPSAACLSASMRDLGYSLETAIADLIDNSISAQADNIAIYCDVSADDPVVVVLDNGQGMTDSQLLDAMRHGSNSPKQVRSKTDLGRFGLGLKTASFSQCRSLTVVSLRETRTSGYEWDLDLIDSTDNWVLKELDLEEIKRLPFVSELSKSKSGTAVIWKKLDRLIEEDSHGKREEIVNEKLDVVRKHLSLVFHRFMSGEVKEFPKISIIVNGHQVLPFDPFCKKNLATQILPEEKLEISGSEIRIQPYILPHHSRLSPSEYDYYRSRSDFISNQGCYVYRNGRLMAWGDWFRMVPKGEATKLARVQIDFTNSLDEAWTIDIKKSRARPPLIVRERLRKIIEKIISRSIKVHRGRGQKLFQDTEIPVWDRYVDQDGIRFEINQQHPLIGKIICNMTKNERVLFNILLDSIASSLPVEMIYSDYSTNPRDIKQNNNNEDFLLRKLASLHEALDTDSSMSKSRFEDIVNATHLLDENKELLEKFIKEKYS